ncbi:signal transduction histidine kinase [Salipiger pallidus]|uniref:histidine kinase n=1 Tax=Salipiger pallidus TaxID=1775170 RepID=A0A8J2ZJ56_9RHOB|nr:PAS-domain containing protein [Salipiger pallidus]GGG70602.1 signal transduction histidine kinase [Salipiger pallidus]
MSKDALTQAGLNLIQQALSIYDSDLRLAVCNRPFVEMFELPERLAVEGADFAETIHHLVTRGEYGDVADVDAFVRARVKQARAFEPHYMERERASGQVISVEGSPLPQGGWVTVYTDITATRRQERLLRTRSELLSGEVLARSEALAASNRQLAAANAALAEAQRELREIEARTRLTTEMMPAHIARVNASLHYTFSNRRLPLVMPGRPADIIGLHVRDALGAAQEKVVPCLHRALAGEQSVLEFTDDGSSRRIRAVFTPDPAEPGVYILSHDVTEETQARAALQQTRRRELAAQLTSGLAHDFSNLLTIILSMQSRLARLVDQPEAEPLITATTRAARRGGDLLGRIADMTSHRSWRPEAVALRPFLREIEVLATPSLPAGIAFEVLAEAEGEVLLDPGMLQDAVLNLLLNAADACGGHGHIRLAVRTIRDTWLEIELRDSGTGFSPHVMAHALDPFFTTKGGEGSGLGLAMVYDMVKLAGGDIKLGNHEGGAVVTLRLPLRRAEALPRQGLVLLVEDSLELRAEVREMLTALGYSVVEASSVDEAVMLAEGLPVELVLSDITLEGEASGTALPGLLPHLPVRLMTSLPPGHALHIEALRHGPVLAKPFGSETLVAFLETDSKRRRA